VGLIHGLRGRPSNHARKASFKQEVLERYAQRYADFGPTLAVEHLTQDGLEVRRETLWRWLLKAGLWSRRQRGKVHRSRRERRSCLGEMVQMDGSHHDWFEGRGGWCVLMVMIDGRRSAMASCCTGRTPRHVPLISRLCEVTHPTLTCYGSDSVGREGTNR